MHVDYIMTCIKRIQWEGIKAMKVRSEPIHELHQHAGIFYQAYNVLCVNEI